MDFSSQLQTVSEETLNALFSENDPSTKVEVDPIEKDPVVNQIVQKDSSEEIPFIDDVEILNDNDDKEEKKDDGDSSKKDEPNIDIDQVKSVLKNTTNYLIEKGVWQDFDGRADLDIDEETYAELSAKQAETQVNDLFSELIDSTGDYGKAIIAHIKNGGNPDEIIDIFKEQKQIENIDITKPANAEILIEKYYNEVVGWSNVKIKRYIDSLKADEDGLSSEATEVQQKFEEIYAEDLRKVTEQQKESKKKQEEDNKEYLGTLSTAIDTFEDFTDEDKKIVKNSIFKTTKKINGVPVNEFFAKFYEIQKDPKKYIELVHMVMAPEKYKSKIEAKEQKKITVKQWNFVKGNAAVKNTNSQGNVADEGKTSKLNFGGIVFNKR